MNGTGGLKALAKFLLVIAVTFGLAVAGAVVLWMWIWRDGFM